MQDAIMIAIQPKWCKLILSGKKTIEVRKTIPKLETPFKCYIYCTKGKSADEFNLPIPLYRESEFYDENGRWREPSALKANGKVIGEFVCDYITRARADTLARAYANNNPAETCMTDHELCNYSSIRKPVYFLHISELKIYDVPREPDQFWGRARCLDAHTPDCWCCCARCREIDGIRYQPLKRGPQSWCYVEALC